MNQTSIVASDNLGTHDIIGTNVSIPRAFYTLWNSGLMFLGDPEPTLMFLQKYKGDATS